MSSTVNKIKEKLDITDVVSSYVKLERAGKNLKGRCPFHNEKTPSFFVSPDRDTFHCFGCDKGGDIFTFIGEIEGLDFLGSLKLLADKAGVEIKDGERKDTKKKDRLLKIVDHATLYYSSLLKKEDEALAYLKERGLTEKTIQDFRLGFAKNEWRNLLSYFEEKKVTPEELEEVGLAIKKDDGGFYDRFRGRIMFPLEDRSGRVIAFSGRVFGGDEKTAKYINSPETELYHKSSVLYGLGEAKTGIREEKACIIVEGQMDVLLSHQAGFTNTVATSGTALTTEQLKYLGRLTDTLVMAFDADPAGIAASGRGVDLALAEEFNVKVVHVPKGKDPADIIKENPEEWRALLKGAESIIDFYLKVLHEHAESDHEYRKAVEKKVLPYVLSVKSKMDQAHYISRIADALKIKEDAVWEEFSRLQDEKDGEPQRTNTFIPQEEKEIPQENHGKMIRTRLLGIFLWAESQKEKGFDTEKVYAEYEKLTGENPQKEIDALGDDAREKKIFEAEVYLEEDADSSEEIEELLSHLKEHVLKERLLKAMGELRSAEARSDTESVSHILELCNSITKELNELTNKRHS